MGVAAAALILAIVGTAIAGPEAITRAVTKSSVKKVAKKQANKAIDQRAPGLDVSSAQTAASAEDSARLGGQPPSAFAPSEVEPYHEIGAPGEPAFGAAWTNDPAPGTATAAFYKDPFGVVHLKGKVVRSGGTAVMTGLPPGYRPAQTTCMASAFTPPAQPLAPTQICVFPGGDLAGTGTGDGAYLLDGLTFRAG